MRIAVVGGGSMGMMWTARLLLAGFHPILFVRNQKQVEMIRQHGLIFMYGKKRQLIHPNVEISDLKQEIESFDLIIVAVKQTQIDSIIPWLIKYANSNAYVLTLQNGAGHIEKLRSIIDEEQLIIGITTEGALRRSLNEVEKTGSGTTWIGRSTSSAPNPQLQEYINILSHKGIELLWDDRIIERLWKKLIINCAINPLTAIYGLPNGKLIDSPHIKQIISRLTDEAIQVAHAEGVQINQEILQEIENVCRNTSKNLSSMLQDVIAGRPTEIDWINGYIVQRGKEHQVSTKTHELIIQLLHGREEMGFGSE